MKQRVKIAVFGLSLNILDNIKHEVGLIYDENVELSWVNIADSELNILLVNDVFFESTTIQNIVTSSQVSYLRLVNKNEKSGSITGDILYLPFVITEEVRRWFKTRVQVVTKPVQKPESKTLELPRVSSGDYRKVVTELLNERNGNIQVFDSNGNIALISARTEQVWPYADRLLQGTDQTINFTYATMQMAQGVSHIQGIDLRTWLWNTLWFSPALLQDLTKKSSSHLYYKLQYWPQPHLAHDRKDILKIAACFEKGGSVEQIVQKFAIDQAKVDQFVAVSLMCQALKIIPEQEAYLTISAHQQIEKTHSTGFFGQLKKKLGL